MLGLIFCRRFVVVKVSQGEALLPLITVYGFLLGSTKGPTPAVCRFRKHVVKQRSYGNQTAKKAGQTKSRTLPRGLPDLQ
jgi:hypothetical protein